MTPEEDARAGRIVIDALGAALAALAPDARIAIAYSGGLDSSVLLDAAVRTAGAARVVALHVHHGLSPNADRWLAHARDVARAYGVAFDARRVTVPRDDGASVEAAARVARYDALDAMAAAHRANVLWLAQHADDQAETVLLQLLRGAGLAGLAAMAPWRAPPDAVPRARPLLNLLRAQLEAYARVHALAWIDDESNADTRYARNALRHDVLPALSAHFPGFRDALVRTASHAASAQHLLDALAQIDLQAAALDDGAALSRAALLALDDARALNLLRYWMRLLGLPAASAARVADALRQLRDADASARGQRIGVEHAGRRLRCYRDRVFWESAEDAPSGDVAARAPVECVWRGEEVWRVPAWRGTFVFAPSGADDPDALPEAVLRRAPLVARARTGGERMRAAQAGRSRTLKNLFQERGVPAWERDAPLLFSGDVLLYVPSVGVNRGAWLAAVESGARWRRVEWRADLQIA